VLVRVGEPDEPCRVHRGGVNMRKQRERSSEKKTMAGDRRCGSWISDGQRPCSWFRRAAAAQVEVVRGHLANNDTAAVYPAMNRLMDMLDGREKVDSARGRGSVVRSLLRGTPAR
jgi:hypothetical protein